MSVEIKTWYCFPEEVTSLSREPLPVNHEGCPGRREKSIVGAWRCPCPCHLEKNEATGAWHFKNYPGANPIERPAVFTISDKDQAKIFAEVERMVSTPVFELKPEERERIKRHNQALDDLRE